MAVKHCFGYARECVSEGIFVWVGGPGGEDLPLVRVETVRPAGDPDGK